MEGTIDQGHLKRGAERVSTARPLCFGVAGPADDASLRRLLRENPMGGRISVSLECEPSFLDAMSIEGGFHQTIVARETDAARIVAMGSRSVREAFVNGLPTRIGYLGHLRIDPSHRHRVRLLRGGFASARPRVSGQDSTIDLTCIMADNRPAIRLLTAGLSGLPCYLEQERIFTLAMPTSRTVRTRRNQRVHVESGSATRLDEIVACLDRNNRRFQFAPRWTSDDLTSPERCRGLQLGDFHVALSNGRMVGCLARWNQRAFKQVVIRGYSPALRRARPLFNSIAPLLGKPRLPRVGESINSVFLSHLAVDGDDPTIAMLLLKTAHRCARTAGHDLVILSLAGRHPLFNVIRRGVSHRSWESILYVVRWHDRPDAPFDLDGRVAHVEAAIL